MPQAVLKARTGSEAGVTKRPNLLMTAGIGLTQRDEKKELLYGLMGARPAQRRVSSVQMCTFLFRV